MQDGCTLDGISKDDWILQHPFTGSFNSSELPLTTGQRPLIWSGRSSLLFIVLWITRFWHQPIFANIREAWKDSLLAIPILEVRLCGVLCYQYGLRMPEVVRHTAEELSSSLSSCLWSNELCVYALDLSSRWVDACVCTAVEYKSKSTLYEYEPSLG